MPIYYEAKAIERAIDATPRITPSTKSVLKKIVRSAPVADAAPVVRCKNCKHKSEWQPSSSGYQWCGVSGLQVVDDISFCSYGERMSKEG